jgi:hypothetical protein
MGESTSSELQRQEVCELTDLLRTDDSFADLRAALISKGVNPAEVVLAGLIESEEEDSYAVLVKPDLECIRFEVARDNSVTLWETVDDLASLAGSFGAVIWPVERIE